MKAISGLFHLHKDSGADWTSTSMQIVCLSPRAFCTEKGLLEVVDSKKQLRKLAYIRAYRAGDGVNVSQDVR